MEREELISKKLLDARNELNNSLNCARNCAPADYDHKRIKNAFQNLKYWLQKRLELDIYTGKVDPLMNDYPLTSEI